MFKRLLALALSILMIMIMGTTASALETPRDNLHKDLAYEYILNDYLLVTGLNENAVNRIYDEVKNGDFKDVDKIEQILYNAITNTRFEDTVLYLQNNYDEIVSSISAEQKELVDKYLLHYALEYYISYSNIEDFQASPQTISNLEVEEPILIDNDVFEELYVNPNEVVLGENAPLAGSSTQVASLRIFADPSTNIHEGSSGLEMDLGVHAWITISNISNNNITIGKFSIPANKTLALGTWGNQDEHIGLWYNIESKRIRDNDSYSARVFVRVDITEDNLSKANGVILSSDAWSRTNNCSSFAVKVWNKVCSTRLSAGIINTPKTLGANIKKVDGYVTGFDVPHHYKIYYANGSQSPVLSRILN